MPVSLGDLLKAKDAIPESRCVVRVRTAVWDDERGVYQKKSLTFLRRKCAGFNLLAEDAGAIGAADIVPRILNLDSSPDGVYEVVMCNESHDYETGHIDDYDYRLVKLNSEEGD